MSTNLVVADEIRTGKMIGFAVSPSLQSSKASSVILHNPLYNAPGGEDQPQGNARVPISAKLGTESRFWAFVGVPQKRDNCGLLFSAFMLYLSKALPRAF